MARPSARHASPNRESGLPPLLVVDRQSVVAPQTQRLGDVLVQVFIDLEPHHAAPGTKGMICSRASSAA